MNLTEEQHEALRAARDTVDPKSLGFKVIQSLIIEHDTNKNANHCNSCGEKGFVTITDYHGIACINSKIEAAQRSGFLDIAQVIYADSKCWKCGNTEHMEGEISWT